MTRAEVLQAAEKCVCGDRDEQYGNPEDSFTVIADLWGAYRDEHYKPHDVAIMLALMKIARIVTGVQKEDSYVDAVGYLACAGEIATRKPPEVVLREIEGATCGSCAYYTNGFCPMGNGGFVPENGSCLEWERKIGE